MHDLDKESIAVSPALSPDRPDSDEAVTHPANGEQVDQELVPTFKEFGLSELRATTNGFSNELIISESGEKAPIAVHKGS
ncbi:hypothetical protein CDL15_Pgr022116 [Punica granatum]|uniref:Uncharacterized protein n=1 Tax=Punica granatum TaxID=22663 RepID=A0A218VTM7_PUNGR|nr:hypothetical protein CDL15_Pgr022116 [Punica granatum]